MENRYSSPTKRQRKPKVAIIGAGVCGLLSARYLKDSCDISIFEARDGFGGQWNYTPQTESTHPALEDDAFYKLYGSLSSSMYAHLTTIVPKFCMQLKDLEFPESQSHTVTTRQYYDYLTAYAQKFDLEKFINYDTTVELVKPVMGQEPRYKVKTTPTSCSSNREDTEDFYDYVMVCTGHFSVPYFPDFEGQSDYDGDTLHIHQIREPEPKYFDNKNVLIIGASISALDIIAMVYFKKSSRENLNPNKVFIASHDVSKFKTSDDYKDLIECGQLIVKEGNVTKMSEGKSVSFGDGSTEIIDTIIYCTGYKYCFPFFDPDDKLFNFNESHDRGTKFGPLYKKLWSCYEPGIMFPGLVYRKFLTMLTFERQVMLCAQFIRGDITLPSIEEMLEEVKLETKDSDGKYNVFALGESAFKYNDELVKMSKIPEDKRYLKFKAIHEYYFAVKEKGDELKSRHLDYDKLFERIVFKPTSSLF